MIRIDRARWLRAASARPADAFGLALALASIAIYAWTVFILPQVRDNGFVCERSSVAAAVSNAVWGARPGALYRGVLDQLLQTLDKPLETVLDELPRSGPPPARPNDRHPLMRATEDGNGAGFPLVATVAFRLFGIHAWALPLTTVGLMALAAAAFLGRFSSAMAGVVALYFGALTLMLFTSLVWSPLAAQTPVGGIRYFSLVAILPTFHLLLEFADPERPAWRTRRRRYRLLGAQAAILAVAIIVRGSAVPVMGALGLVWLVLAWRRRRDRALFPLLLRKAEVSIAVGLGLLGIMFVVVPSDYHTQGRFGTVIWHRVTLSFGANPAWPFPGVNDMFDCKKYVPEGIQSGMPDSNGHCMWLDYVEKNGKWLDPTYNNLTYAAPYEAVLRGVFFEIARRYPAETAATFFYWKPRLILPALQGAAELDFSHYSALAVSSFVAALAIFLAVPVFLAGIPASGLRSLAGIAALSAGFTLPAYIAVWAMPHTVADLLLDCVLLTGLGLCGVSLAARAALRAGTSPPLGTTS